MFSKRMILVAVVVILVTANIILLTITGKYVRTPGGPGRGALALVSPFQKALVGGVRSVSAIWHQYFFLVSTADENRKLKQELAEARQQMAVCDETTIAVDRLRRLLAFSEQGPYPLIAAEVVGKDPSPWSRTLIVDKGTRHGAQKGFAVVVPDGIVGVITESSGGFSRVLLLVDPNSAVDALVQETRARGIVKGTGSGPCDFDYVLRKDAVSIGDMVISSGLDGVFPKGLPVGRVSDVMRMRAGIFQKITVTPDVNFDTLEAVFIIPQSPPDPALLLAPDTP